MLARFDFGRQRPDDGFVARVRPTAVRHVPGALVAAPAVVKRVAVTPRVIAAAPAKALDCVEVIRGTLKTSECF